jgi:hypothetical protein
MGDDEGSSQMLLCRHCGDVIGMYEPLIVQTSTERRETSLTAEPRLPIETAAFYHRACYEHAGGGVS